LYDEIDEDSDILERACDALHRETGLTLSVERYLGNLSRHPYDVEVRLEGQPAVFAAEIKKWAQHTNFGALMHKLKEQHHRPMLIADYVNPRMAERLKSEQIQFIDTVGNAYIDSPPIYVYVKGHRTTRDAAVPTSRNRAFDATGLKVIFAFLRDPKLIEATYRDIAQTAEVALGTVGWVINGLKDGGYVTESGPTKTRRLINRKKLLDRWTETYPEKLKPKLFVGHFLAPDPMWWEHIDLMKYGAYWGGEIAAAKYTDYLKPLVATIYLPKSLESKLFADARLRKAFTTDGAGVVKVFRPFWKKEENFSDLVHPILVYADLIATGDSRNLETAQVIYEKYLDQYFREDQ
jgi:hypothetical protein